MPRIKTGIEEFDKMLGGGFMEGDAVLLAGGAGTGKTTLALQHLITGIADGQPGVYVSFEQLPDQIYRDAASFGWDLRKLENEDKLRIMCTSPNLLVDSNGAAGLLDAPFNEIHPRRIVVDSLSHLSMYVGAEDFRKTVYRTLNFFKTRGLSSLLIWEAPQTNGQSFTFTDYGLSFLVDAVVVLKFVEIESAIKTALVIMKMRGSNHDRRLREYQITPTGVKIQGNFADYEGVMSGAPRKASSEKFVELFTQASKRK